MYGSHPYGTRSKSEVNNARGTRLRWRERTSIPGREFPVTVRRVKVA